MKLATALFSIFLSGVALADSKPITVAMDGSGDYKTVQDAITAAPEKGAEQIVIHIKPGKYTGPFVIPKNKPHITLEGEASDKCILTWDRNVNDPKPEGADGFNSGLNIRSGDCELSNLTIENTSGNHGQALALRIDADRVVVKNCRITGWQDTLYINEGRHYFKDCFISGRVDFIYGNATAWFENCEIQSRNGGHVTAASTPEDHPFGFIFNKCKLTSDDEPWNPATTNPATTQPVEKKNRKADLGRPWRPFAMVCYLNCEMGDHIIPAGWNNWRKVENEKTARYCEYNTTGPGANPAKRFAWTKQLTKEEAEKITPEAVLSGSDGWTPFAK